mmetsp:Transcript_35716/g.83038  ORF Transcript_35716/g.83038 Transcript_35716/m.83038 type:complete len:376 (-) Transcript_35716:84-1211(-)
MGLALSCAPCSCPRKADDVDEFLLQEHKPDTPSTAPSSADLSVDSTLEFASAQEAHEAGSLLAAVRADPQLFIAVQRHRGGESLLALCTRFSRARPRSTARALAMLTADMKYRDELGVLALARQPACQVLAGKKGQSQGMDAAALEMEHFRQFPHGFLGQDRKGRTIVYKKYGGVRFWELAKLGTNVETLVRYHIWVQEQSLQAMGHKGQWFSLVDLEGLTLAQCVAKAHLLYVRDLMGLDGLHYPERLGMMIIINAPAVFAGPWRMIHSLADAKTRRKVQVLGGPSQWKGPLAEVMDLRLLPRSLGGETDLSPAGLKHVPSRSPSVESLPCSVDMLPEMKIEESRWGPLVLWVVLATLMLMSCLGGCRSVLEWL